MAPSEILDVEGVTTNWWFHRPAALAMVFSLAAATHKTTTSPSGTGAQKPETHMSVPDSTSQHLEYLRDVYVYKVNAALEQGREDLAAELADDYLDEVRNALEVASHPRG
jgi:hypothetical protein